MASQGLTVSAISAVLVLLALEIRGELPQTICNGQDCEKIQSFGMRSLRQSPPRTRPPVEVPDDTDPPGNNGDLNSGGNGGISSPTAGPSRGSGCTKAPTADPGDPTDGFGGGGGGGGAGDDDCDDGDEKPEELVVPFRDIPDAVVTALQSTEADVTIFMWTSKTVTPCSASCWAEGSSVPRQQLDVVCSVVKVLYATNTTEVIGSLQQNDWLDKWRHDPPFDHFYCHPEGHTITPTGSTKPVVSAYARPGSIKICNTIRCDRSAVSYGSWSECELEAGLGQLCGKGKQSRAISCASEIWSYRLPLGSCRAELTTLFNKDTILQNPQLQGHLLFEVRECDMPAASCSDRFRWQVAAFPSCPEPCAANLSAPPQVSRAVTCVDFGDPQAPVVAANSTSCSATAPDSTRFCNKVSCSFSLWQAGAWSDCKADGADAICNGGKQTRQVTCSNGSGCAGEKPAESRTCAMVPCKFCAGSSTSGGSSKNKKATSAASLPAELQGDPCGGRGVCIDSNALALCSCNDPFSGKHCQLKTGCNGILDKKGNCCTSNKVDFYGRCCTDGQTLDAQGLCCDKAVDKCGVCGGTSVLGLDRMGQCCPGGGALDASGLCCESGLIDHCGICDGDGRSCALNMKMEFTANDEPAARGFRNQINTQLLARGVSNAVGSGPHRSGDRWEVSFEVSGEPVDVMDVYLAASQAEDASGGSIRDSVMDVVPAVTAALNCGNGMCELGEQRIDGQPTSATTCSEDCGSTPLLTCQAPSTIGLITEPCGGHGACKPSEGECQCFAGYEGPECGTCSWGFVEHTDPQSQTKQCQRVGHMAPDPPKEPGSGSSSSVPWGMIGMIAGGVVGGLVVIGVLVVLVRRIIAWREDADDDEDEEAEEDRRAQKARKEEENNARQKGRTESSAHRKDQRERQRNAAQKSTEKRASGIVASAFRALSPQGHRGSTPPPRNARQATTTTTSTTTARSTTQRQAGTDSQRREHREKLRQSTAAGGRAAQYTAAAASAPTYQADTSTTQRDVESGTTTGRSRPL